MNKLPSSRWTSFLPRAALITTMLASSFRLAAATVPVAPAPPIGNVEVARFYGIGYQVYVSTRRADDPTRFEWTLQAPSARLYNGGGRVMGTHYKGPTWEANNGSKVVAIKEVSVDAPDPNAIPWLLLRATGHEGHGMFSEVTYIQRLDTRGGKAPTDAPTEVGVEVRVPYRATYVFFELQTQP